MAAIRETFSSTADWASAVEHAVRGELDRRRRWIRLYMALLVLLMAATLALLVMGVAEVVGVKRELAPAVAATQRLQVQGAQLQQGQQALAARLTVAESALSELRTEVDASQRAQAAAVAAPPPPPSRVAALGTDKGAATGATPRRPSRLSRRVTELESRMQAVEAAASAARRERDHLTGQVLRLDSALERLGAAIGPQSSP